MTDFRNSLLGFNMIRKALRNGLTWLIVLTCAGFMYQPLAAETLTPEDGSAKTLAEQIYIGKFVAAQKQLTTMPSALTNKPSDPMRDSLEGFCVLMGKREEWRGATYDLNVKEAKKLFAEEKIEDALSAARKARFYAKDPKAFGELDWLKELSSKAKDIADEYLKKHEWLKAGNIYAELTTIYEDNKDYEKLTRDVAMRVRLEAMYKPKTDWEERMEDIKYDVIPEVSMQVARYYVEKPDFAKMIENALGSLSMVTEVPKMAEVFPALGDKEKSAKYNQELKNMEAQTKCKSDEQEFTTRDFWQAFVKLMMVNDESCNLPLTVVVREFMDAALSELDPFTNVIWPAEVKDFDKHTTGRFSGVGIQISMENNKLKVVTPIPGSPAYRAGVVPGDYITSIDGEKTEGITIDQAVRKITGPKGTQVTLGITHSWNQKTRDVVLTRDTILIKTVKGIKMDNDNNWDYFVDSKKEIAYIRITSFTDTTPDDLIKALDSLQKDGAKGLILDLRFNPGGTLRAAVETVDLFVDNGVIVSTRGRSVEPWQRSATPNTTKFRDLPIIVLINNYSASAAEILSGALKDYHRAWLIGERSFGKGSVQNVISSSDDSYRLKITTAHYYLPSGKCIHKKPDSKEWGVDPNLKIELTPNEIKDVIDLQREAEIVIQVNGVKTDSLPTSTQAATSTSTSTAPADEDLTSPRTYPPTDIQLSAAIAVMQARLTLNVPWENITLNSTLTTQATNDETSKGQD